MAPRSSDSFEGYEHEMAYEELIADKPVEWWPTGELREGSCPECGRDTFIANDDYICVGCRVGKE